MAPLPFDQLATVQALGGDEIAADVPCSSAWPAGQRATNVGEAYDFTAQADLDYADDLDAANRQIVIDGVTYRIVEVGRHEFLPHVELRLRRVRG